MSEMNQEWIQEPLFTGDDFENGEQLALYDSDCPWCQMKDAEARDDV